VERIVSRAHASAPGEWYDQETAELVVLVSGGATLAVEGRAEPIALAPGDWMDIPARVRHRVEHTAAGENTVWLTVHYRARHGPPDEESP
jgi:cupin 2 domain-containing protein